MDRIQSKMSVSVCMCNCVYYKYNNNILQITYKMNNMKCTNILLQYVMLHETNKKNHLYVAIHG